MTPNPQKITFGEMRACGVREVLVYCRDHRCSHGVGAVSQSPGVSRPRRGDWMARGSMRAGFKKAPLLAARGLPATR